MKKSKKILQKLVDKKNKISRKMIKQNQIKAYLAKRNNKIFIANWKTNKKFNDIKYYAAEYNLLARRDKVLKRLNFIIAIAPSLMGLLPVQGLMGKNIAVVAQHVAPHRNGDYTGQISYEQVHEYNVNYAMVGHSETRKYLNVTDTFCRDSIRILLKAGMRPILCVGETTEEYEAGKTKKVVMLQLMNSMRELTVEEVRQVIIVYEPTWEVNKHANSHEWIVKITKFIRKAIADLYDSQTGKDIHVLYGGAFIPGKTKEILNINGVDGMLVGNISLKPNNFYEIICSAPEYEHVKSILYPKKNKK